MPAFHLCHGHAAHAPVGVSSLIVNGYDGGRIRRSCKPTGSLSLSHQHIWLRSSSRSISRASSSPQVMSGNGQAACPKEYIDLAQKLADAAGKIVAEYFRSPIGVEQKADESPVTIADREAEAAMRKLIKEQYPNHGIFGEEEGMDLDGADSGFLWVLDPIDGTKSFVTGKPLFGTLISLLDKGEPILGVIDQPILKERWLGAKGHETTLNGKAIHVRECEDLREAYLYATTPHMFAGDAEDAFSRVREQVLQPLYGCDCYAYGLLASGHCDLVVEADLKPYDYMAQVPIIEGAGGVITDWQGQHLHWPVTPSNTYAVQELPGEVLACGDKRAHEQALKTLNWKGGGTYEQAADSRDVTFMS